MSDDVLKSQMVRDLREVLIKAGYKVTQKMISRAYPGRSGAQKLWGVWRRRELAPHWAADKLRNAGVKFKAEPKLEQAPLPFPNFRIPKGAGDLQLPFGDRD